MGVYLRLINHEQEFLSRGSTQAIILNDLDDTSEEQKEQINRTIYTVSGDVFSNVPSCECGNPEIIGACNIGVVCDICHTPVSRRLEKTLDALVWIRAPQGVAPFMNPKLWWMLNKWFTKSDFSVIQYLADATYNPTLKNSEWSIKIIEDLHNNGIEGRGWNYFYQNFDKIIEVLFRISSVRKTGKKTASYKPLHDLILRDRHTVFTNYLPIPNRSLLVIESNDTGRWRDENIDGVIDAMRFMIGIDVGTQRHSQRKKESRVVKTLDALATYYANFDRTNSPKEGIWRKHVMGSRTNFSCRAVISSLTEEHQYDELHIPWGVAISMLRYHVMNKLFRRGYTMLQANHFLNTYALEYHPLLDEIFQELIRESPYKGIPCVHTRNPVLKMGSTQLCFITRVKTDVLDNTVGTSILIVLPWNLDFN